MRSPSPLLVLALTPAVAGLAACPSASPGPASPGPAGADQPAASATIPVTHGVASGVISPTAALVWARADRDAVMHVSIGPDAGGAALHATGRASAARDFTAQVEVRGLAPDTRYRYDVWFAPPPPGAQDVPGDGTGQDPGPAGASAPPPAGAVRGWLRTPPPPDRPAPVRVVWSGDLAGQNVCRDAARGFPIFSHIDRRRPDVFVALGDMIYADQTCEATGRYGNAQVPGDFPPSTRIEHFWAHWRYNRQDPGYRALLAHTPVIPVWDDHEALDDFGPDRDSSTAPPYRGERLLPLALRAFTAYNPVPAGPAAAGQQLHRAVRWGRHLELLVLDTRQHRAPNTAPDAGPPKSMLGPAQRAWLAERLRSSDATWKVIVSSVPLAIPTGDPPGPVVMGRDGWAGFDQDTGYERELLEILALMRDARIARSVWITTDVHFATGFRHRPPVGAPADPSAPPFEVYELAVGPLHAGLFPSRSVDDTLRPERLFFHGPDDPEAIASLDEALPWMSFGELAVDAGGALSIEVVDGLGRAVWSTRLEPPPRMSH